MRGPSPATQQQDYELYYAIFFDGTGNNMLNTDDIIAASTVESMRALLARGDSYGNDYSNVAKLYRLKRNSPAEELRIERKLYLDGIGTSRNGSDSTYGFATGRGDYGMEARCLQALNRVRGEARTISRGADCRAITLYLDLFGFSRGAAAARHCVHLILEADLTELKVEQKNIRFVGLYDSVAAEGAMHSNDVDDLHLNRLGVAEKVVQYAAADEFRSKFELVDINSAVSAGVGTQHYLPGAHSDVGGGYAQNLRETRMKLRDETLFNFSASEDSYNDQRHLERMGYYRSDEWLAMEDGRELYVTRANPIDHLYARVPLYLMVDEINGMSYDFLGFSQGRYSISENRLLMGVKSALRAKMDGGPIPLSEWSQDQPLGTLRLAQLRRTYCHFSSRYDAVGLSPRFVGNARIREIYNG